MSLSFWFSGVSPKSFLALSRDWWLNRLVVHTFTNSGPRETLPLRTMARDNNVAGVVELLERGAPPSYCNRWDLEWGNDPKVCKGTTGTTVCNFFRRSWCTVWVRLRMPKGLGCVRHLFATSLGQVLTLHQWVSPSTVENPPVIFQGGTNSLAYRHNVGQRWSSQGAPLKLWSTVWFITPS